jgi:hypothetical protein
VHGWKLGTDLFISTAHPGLTAAIDVVFHALRCDPAPDALLLDLREDRLWVGNLPILRVPPPMRLPPILEGMLTHYAVLATRSQCGFHGGAVLLNSKLVLLPGDRGSGKSTATLWLSRRGTYLGDDIAFVSYDALAVTGLPKAATLKRGSFDQFPATETYDDLVRGPVRYHLPCPFAHSAPVISRVVFPQYEEGATLSVRTVDAPVAALALAQQSFGSDPRRLDVVGRLAHLPCRLIRYSQLADLEGAVMDLL